MVLSSRSAFVPMLFFVAALSGCAEADASRVASLTTESGPAVVSETTGGIDGRVIDDEQLPVQGASIGIRVAGGTVGNQTTSAGDGAFSFSGLEPGEHELVAQSPFHEAATKKVTVLAGESQAVTFVLTSTAAPVERLVETLALRGHIACSVGWRNPSNPSTSGGNPVTSNPCYQNQGDKSDFKVPVNLELPFTEIVLEAVWQPGTGFSGSRLRM
ncbi:MAG TPA: carboxypeptidase-like regulatory domain-containing protein, partial [Candidatus Thermoplasmatota archaeon]